MEGWGYLHQSGLRIPSFFVSWTICWSGMYSSFKDCFVNISCTISVCVSRARVFWNILQNDNYSTEERLARFLRDVAQEIEFRMWYIKQCSCVRFWFQQVTSQQIIFYVDSASESYTMEFCVILVLEPFPKGDCVTVCGLSFWTLGFLFTFSHIILSF